MRMKKIAILGSTGSIGTQTLEVVENNGDIQVEALSANGNVDLLEKQARKFKPSVIAVFREDAAKELKERLKDMNIRILTGMDGLIEIATLPETDILVTAIVGMIGILPTIDENASATVAGPQEQVYPFHALYEPSSYGSVLILFMYTKA